MRKILVILLLLISPLLCAQTRPSWLQLKDTPYVDVKTLGAKGDLVTDDTAAIQAAIDARIPLLFSNGGFLVSAINFNQNNMNYKFENASIVGDSTATETYVVGISNRYIHIKDMVIYGGKRSGDTAAIHWYSTAGLPAEWVNLEGLRIQDCNIGILFGQLLGETVLDAPQSENIVSGYLTRGVKVPIYMRQPNGFLFITESMLDCYGYEYSTAEGAYASADSYSIINHSGVLHVSSSELLKAAYATGTCILNESTESFKATTKLSNVAIESAATWVNNIDATFSVLGTSGGYFSNVVDPVFISNGGKLLIKDIYVARPSVIDSSSAPVIQDVASGVISLRDSTFSGWRAKQLIKAAYANWSYQSKLLLSGVTFPGDNYSQGNSSFVNLLSSDVEYSYNMASLASETAGVGTSVSTVNVSPTCAGYASATQLVSITSGHAYIDLPAVKVLQGKLIELGYWIRQTAGATFQSRSVAKYYGPDGVTEILSQNFYDTAGGEYPIPVNNATATDWTRVYVNLPPAPAGAAYLVVRFYNADDCTTERTGFTLK